MNAGGKDAFDERSGYLGAGFPRNRISDAASMASSPCAVVYATMIIILVILRVFFLKGLPGAFFRPPAIGYIIAILASLLVALIVTPAWYLSWLNEQCADVTPFGMEPAQGQSVCSRSTGHSSPVESLTAKACQVTWSSCAGKSRLTILKSHFSFWRNTSRPTAKRNRRLEVRSKHETSC